MLIFNSFLAVIGQIPNSSRMYFNNPNNKSGFKMLVYFQRITGQSFMFWNFGKRMDLSLKLVLTFLNTMLFFATSFYLYECVKDVQDLKKNSEFNFSSHESTITFMMQISGYICYNITNVYVYILVQFKGKAVLVFINDLNININRGSEKKIGITTIIIQIALTFVFSLIFFLTSIDWIEIHKNILSNFISYIILIFIISNYLSLLSLMAYFCYVIQQRLTDLQNEFSSLQQLPNIFKQLLVIQSFVKQFDKLFYSKYLFIILLSYSFECINNLTILYFDRFNIMLNTIPLITESITFIFLFCYLSDKINKSYVSIINKYEQLQLLMSDTQLGQFNHSLVSRLYSMRDDLCFTAFNLYPINMKTFMSILSMIVIFTVILIQTHD